MYRLVQLKRKITSSNPPAKYINHFTHVLNHNSVDNLSFNVKFEAVNPISYGYRPSLALSGGGADSAPRSN